MSDTMTAGWTGHQVVDTTGEKIGTVQDVYYDDAMDQPEWLVVKTGLFGTKKVFVPAQEVRMDGDKLMVPYTHDRVKDAPQVSRAEAISKDEERELYMYYGLEFPEPRVTVGAPSDEAISRGPEVTPPDRDTIGTGRRMR